MRTLKLRWIHIVWSKFHQFTPVDKTHQLRQRQNVCCYFSFFTFVMVKRKVRNDQRFGFVAQLVSGVYLLVSLPACGRFSTVTAESGCRHSSALIDFHVHIDMSETTRGTIHKLGVHTKTDVPQLFSAQCS